MPINPNDLYINLIVGLIIHIGHNADQMSASTMLAIHAVVCPVQEEQIPHEAMEALNKFLANAALDEIKIILGWIFDFHYMPICLPENKLIAYSTELFEVLNWCEITAKVLRH